MKLSEIKNPYEPKKVYYYAKDGNTVKYAKKNIKLIREPYYMDEPKTDDYGREYADIYLWYPEIDCGIKLMNITTDIDSERICDYNDDNCKTPENYANAVMNMNFVRQIDIYFIGRFKPDIVPYLKQKRENYITAREKEEAERAKKQKEEEEKFVSEQNEILENQIRNAVQIIKNGGILKNEPVKKYNTKHNCSEYKIINYIARMYGVNIPIKTQGWINSSLAEIKIKDGAVVEIKKYLGENSSRAIWTYMNELVDKIKESKNEAD